MLHRIPKRGFLRQIHIPHLSDVKDNNFGRIVKDFRNEDGSFIQGTNSEEARLHDRTLQGRMNHKVVQLAPQIAQTVHNNILKLSTPGRLRTKVAEIYQSVQKNQLQTAPTLALEANAHISALFLQDYAHCYQVLKELEKRTELKPDSVLTVGYGPATAMIALNEVLGDWRPKRKDAYIVGRFNKEMKKRARLLLSRQIQEYPLANNDQGQQEETQEEPQEEEKEEEYIGPVDTSKLNILTKLHNTLPSKSYDLIIVNHALLTKEHHFPRDIDINIHMLLRLLNPKGHIVLVERGNALGFETIARARQIMIRPEAYEKEYGKIPRPYIKGSTIKPQKLRKLDQMITEDHVKEEEKMLQRIELELGEISDVENINEEQSSPDTQENALQDVDYHLKVIAPCAHHSKCPLQLGDPKYYKISSHKHRMKMCSFDKVVERPQFTMELKRGKKLATKWDKSAEDGMGVDKLLKRRAQQLQGTGRPGGNNTESGSFSYLIVQRSANDSELIHKIQQSRKYNSSETIDQQDINNWPRIINIPTRIKHNVKLEVCGSSGNIETWQIPKSLSKQEYHDARKVEQGDLWGLGNKSVITRNQLSDKVKEKLDILAKTQRKSFIKEQRKKQWKKLVSQQPDDFDTDIVTLSDSIVDSLENDKNYRLRGKVRT